MARLVVRPAMRIMGGAAGLSNEAGIWNAKGAKGTKTPLTPALSSMGRGNDSLLPEGKGSGLRGSCAESVSFFRAVRDQGQRRYDKAKTLQGAQG